MRDVATALRPPILDAGIASAIEWQARRFEARTHSPCLVQVPDNLPALSDAKAIGLFRILQEALTNALRHGDGDIDVRIAWWLDRVDLEVTNSVTDQRSGVGGHGLIGMRERAQLVGGTLQAEGDALRGSHESRMLEAEVQVPAECKGQWLRLRNAARVPALQAVSGRVTVEQVTITPLPPPPAPPPPTASLP